MSGPRKKIIAPDGAKKSVDLGLAAFLKSEEVIDLDSYLNRLVEERAAWRKGVADLNATGEINYSQLASAGRWSDLIAVCEREIAAARNDHGGNGSPETGSAKASTMSGVSAQLWWVKAQLATSMPVLMLAAPLDTVCEAVKQSQDCSSPDSQPGQLFRAEEQALFLEVLVAVARTLQKSDESALSVKFLEKAFRLDASYKQELVALVQKELDTARERLRRRKSKRLTNWIEELETLAQEIGSSVELEVVGESEAGSAAAPRKPEKEKHDRKKSGSWVLVATLAICVAIGVSLFLKRAGLPTEFVEESTELTDLGVSSQAVPMLPLPDKVSRSDAPSLSSVWDELASQVAGVGSSGVDQRTKLMQPNSTSAAPKIVATMVATAALVPNNPHGSLSSGGLSVDGPAEPLEVAALRNNFKPEKSTGGNQMTFSNDNQPLFHGDSRNDPIVEGFPQGNIKTEATYAPKDCEVLVKTWVRDRPSEGGIGLQEVTPGQLVTVVEPMGSWWRIQGRNKKKEGYLRTDAADCR